MVVSAHPDARILRDVRTPRATVLRMATIALSLFAGGCSGPALEPWHTEKLTEEFTAAKTDEVRSFDGYLQLEAVLSPPAVASNV